MTDLILGTAQLRSNYGIAARGDASERGFNDVAALMQVAANAGFTAADTAPAYADAEQALGVVGTTLPIHTKLDPSLSPVLSVRRSLRRLRRTSLDAVYLHDPAEVCDPDSQVLAEASRLVGREIVKLGASIYEVDEFLAAIEDPRIVLVQVPLSLVDRRFDGELLRRAEETGTEVIARSVLLQGVLTLNPESLPTHLQPLAETVASLRAFATERGRTALDVAISFVRDIPGVAGLVLGASTESELMGLGDAFRSPQLTEKEREELEALSFADRMITDPRKWETSR
jgi:aryl-alcohol dehydrogenase-like predicted oxidoreductase